MLGNMKVKTENNLDYLDGYEELPSESQEKIARAFEQGHVDDEDWKGVSARIWSMEHILNSVRIFRRTVRVPKAFDLQPQRRKRTSKVLLMKRKESPRSRKGNVAVQEMMSMNCIPPSPRRPKWQGTKGRRLGIITRLRPPTRCHNPLLKREQKRGEKGRQTRMSTEAPKTPKNRNSRPPRRRRSREHQRRNRRK